MGITIKEVAEKAGVAPSTVSRVIHNNSRISRETRDRVREAMEKLGYHPNAAARSLAEGKTRTIGLIIPDSEEDLFVKPFFIQALRGLSIEAKKQSYNIMFTFSGSQEEELGCLEQFVRQNIVDGIVLMTARDDDKSMAFLEEKDCPYVVIGRPADHFKKALWVDNDNTAAMFRMTEYFLKQGKKQIAFLGGPLTYRVTRNRLDGYRKALEEWGISPDEKLIHLSDDFLEPDGFKGMESLLSRGRPDAVAAADDYLAIGAMEYMKTRGVNIAVSGFNNTMKGGIISPALTSVDIQSEELGVMAASILIRKLEEQDETAGNIHFLVDTRLIERESTNL